MNNLLVICFVGVTLCMSLLTKDIVALIKAKRMIKRTVSNCFEILKEKEVNTNER